MTHYISVDARMVNASGIGVYLQNILPFIVKGTDWFLSLIGDPDILNQYPWAESANVSIVPSRAPIYSLKQQFSLPLSACGHSDLFWSPHYDVAPGIPGKLVVTVHDVAHLALRDIFSGVAKRLYARTMMQVVRLRANGIIYVSQSSRDEFHRLVGVPRGAEAVIHNGVAEAWSDPHWRATERPLNQPYIVCVGNVKPHKNIRRLIAAFDMLKSCIPHDLVIIGQRSGFITGDDDSDTMAGMIDGRVHFTGHLANDELKRYVSHAALLVMPSLYEGFGFPPIEAMAAGCPTAVSRIAALSEVCGDAAVYFDALDVGDMARAIRSVVSNPSLCKKLKDAGYRRARKYNWRDSASKHIALLEAALKSRQNA